ncbi:alpha-L-rhamnosidase C-terminal domain-containing protein [Spirillospora sp. NPDC046719]
MSWSRPAPGAGGGPPPARPPPGGCRPPPRPGGGLTWAEVTYDCPYGRIEAGWRAERGRFSLEVTVPPGTTAEVVLPDGTRAEAGPGAHAFAARAAPADSGVA